RDRRDRATDSRTVLSAAAAAVAQQIIDLDRRYATSVRPRAGNNEGFAERYRRLSAEYGQLLEEVTAADRAGEVDFTGYTRRAERLADQLRALAA
ncbi:MAG: hypothetical protein J2P15_18155, partial [Micromonosporaceae bacterium]|nr:hypothetical protein [Micromonosporaceae bacterium]